MKLSKKRRNDLNAYCNCCVYNNREDIEFPCNYCKHNDSADIGSSDYGNKWVEIKIYRKFKAEVIFKCAVYKVNSIHFNHKGILKSIDIYNAKFGIDTIRGKALEGIEFLIVEEVIS